MRLRTILALSVAMPLCGCVAYPANTAYEGPAYPTSTYYYSGPDVVVGGGGYYHHPYYGHRYFYHNRGHRWR